MSTSEHSDNYLQTCDSTDSQSCRDKNPEPVDIIYKSRVAAAALALFGGALGLHRFYLGQWRGLFYLFFCWTPIPWLVALIECVVFMATDQPRWNQKHNSGVSNGRESAKVLAAFLIIGAMLAVTALIASAYIPFKMLSGMANMQSDINAAQVASTSAQNYIMRTGRRPQRLSQLDLPANFKEDYATRLQIENGRIKLLYQSTSARAGGQLIMQPVIVEGQTFWDCSASTVSARLFPDNCR